MAGEYQYPGSQSDPENEITVPNVFDGASLDDDPAKILPGLSAQQHDQVPAWEQPSVGDATKRYAAGQQYGGDGYGSVPQYDSHGADPYGAAWSGSDSATNIGGRGPAGATSSDGAQQLTPLPAERVRRRRALYGVLAVVVLTVAVVLTAILVAPKWSKDNAQPSPTAPPGPTSSPSGMQSTTSSPPSGSSESIGTSTSTVPQIVPPLDSKTSAPSTASSQGAVVHTVTVTAGTGPAAHGSRTTATSTSKPPMPSTPTTAPKTTAPKTTAPKATAPTTTTKPAPPKNQLGVPREDIACSNGYIVQLASELDEATFKTRVAALKAQGMVPAGAKAANSTGSCAIFSNQSNTWVLYVGPFGAADQGCSARLNGPADAFIKGGNPGSSGTYYSCVCPANPASIPQVGPGSNQHGWIGELQRVMANRLNDKIDPLGAGQWGVYTPQTQAAVKKFQSDHRLPATGSVDAATWAAIKSASC